MDQIRIIATGGTIDDLEYSREEDAPKRHNSLIPSLLTQARVALLAAVTVLMQKDSKFITDEDREKIADTCRNTQEKRIIITHGTMTMPETARYLQKAQIPKTIVLLGSAIPANKANSDALFNLGAAIAAAQLLQEGVWVVMNGKVFGAENVRKNMQTGVFEGS